MSSSTSANAGRPSLSASSPSGFSVGSAIERTPPDDTPDPFPRLSRAGGTPFATLIDVPVVDGDLLGYAKFALVVIFPRSIVAFDARFILMYPAAALLGELVFAFFAVMYFSITGPTYAPLVLTTDNVMPEVSARVIPLRLTRPPCDVAMNDLPALVTARSRYEAPKRALIVTLAVEASTRAASTIVELDASRPETISLAQRARLDGRDDRERVLVPGRTSCDVVCMSPPVAPLSGDGRGPIVSSVTQCDRQIEKSPVLLEKFSVVIATGWTGRLARI